MKRKDWISLIAVFIIVAIAALGEYISVQGEALLALGNMWYVLPMIIFLVGAVLLAKRKGNHSSLFKILSWVSYGLGLLFLFLMLPGFMHFFNVQDSQKKKTLTEKATMVMTDFTNMYQAYYDGVERRKTDYQNRLKTAITDLDIKTLKAVAPNKALTSWVPKDSKTFADDWSDNTMMHTYEGYKKSLDSITPIINKVIIDDFNIFTAGGKFVSLQQLYITHKNALENSYKKSNRIEEIDEEAYELIFNNREPEWNDAQNVLSEKEFGIGGFIVFIILAFLASLTFLCVKDESIRKPKMRTNVTSVYAAGHKL